MMVLVGEKLIRRRIRPIARSQLFNTTNTTALNRSGLCDRRGEYRSLSSVDQKGNTLKYDAWNRLVSVANSSGRIIAEYSYDANWQAIETRTNGTAASNVSSQMVWSAAYINAAVLQDSYSGGAIEPNARLYFTQDADWNTTAVIGYDSTTQTWGVVQRYVYSPYGSITVLNSDWSTPAAGTQPLVDNLYQGMTLDAVTGLYDDRFRNYSPTLGRWTSQDPLGYINGANTYQFLGSDPGDFVDPSGLSWAWWGAFFSALPQGLGAGFHAVSADLAVGATFGQNQYVNEVDQQAWQQTGAAGTWVQDASRAATATSVLAAAAAAAALTPEGSAAGGAIRAAANRVAEAVENGAPSPTEEVEHCPASDAPNGPAGEGNPQTPFNENKLNHIFGNSSHNLGPLLQTFNGDQAAAAQALQELGQQAADAGAPDGLYTPRPPPGSDQFPPISGTINGVPVEVTGEISGGGFRLGTAWSPAQ
ncbi:MAG: RHS repeat-associated core domain-containing protein [Phycisphaerae bacterium]